MPFNDYKFDDKPIKLWKAYTPDKLNLYRSIVSNPFRFVEFFIKTSSLQRQAKDEVLLLWGQAEEFYRSSQDISAFSRPLPSYYCQLNAVKTLLKVKGIPFHKRHGVFGRSVNSQKWSLANEQLTIEQRNVAGSFYHYLDNSHVSNVTYNLKELFYNLPFTHRAYLHTFENQKDLFLPTESPRFSIVNGEIKLTAKCLTENLTYKQNEANFVRRNSEFSLETHIDGRYIVSEPICLSTLPSSQINTHILSNYKKLRSSFSFIEGERTLWYFRKSTSSRPANNRVPLPIIIFAITHKLSELSRYEPLRLKKHLDQDYGWMMHEFIDGSLDQFIAFISCEVCGRELAKPRLR